MKKSLTVKNINCKARIPLPQANEIDFINFACDCEDTNSYVFFVLMNRIVAVSSDTARKL